MEQSDITPDLQNFNLTVPPDNPYVHQCFKMANLIYHFVTSFWCLWA